MNNRFTLINRVALLVLLLSTLNPQLSTLQAQSSSISSFTYQGRLDDTNGPANGTYDFSFALFTASTGGSQVGLSVARTFLPVTNGLFTVPLEFLDANSFSGADRWLEIAVHRSGVGTNLTLSPRQQITAAPYAIRAASLAGTLPQAQLPAAVVINGASGVVLSGTFTGNGTGVSNVNAVTLGGVPAGGFWKTNGNAGANPANGAFLGTTDNLPVEFRANGARVLRLEPNAQGVIGLASAPNVIGGWEGNLVTGGAVGATVWGGGSDVYANTVGADFGTVSGGRQNTADAAEATVAGGRANTASGLNSTVSGGYANFVNGIYGTIAGGEVNVATNADYAAIGGGILNTIQSNAYYATIGGGALNSVRPDSWRGTVSGGLENTVGAPEGTVAGGAFNSALAFSATVGGGGGNAASGEWSTIAGGRDNTLTNADYATIGGGRQNVISPNAYAATIPGGLQNSAADSYAFAAGRRAKANHSGPFVWADATAADFASSATNQFLIRASGGVGINNNNPNGAALAVNGNVTVEGVISANGFSAASATTPEVITPRISTSGNVPLEFYVNSLRALRLEPNSSSPNVIGGYSGNIVSSGVVGAFIGGGGSASAPNRVSGNFAAVLGGDGNLASSNSAVAMGHNSTASGKYSTAMGTAATASGFGSAAIGETVNSSGEASLALGGQTTASADYSTAMGYFTTASGLYSTAMGSHTIVNFNGFASTAAGYYAQASHQGAFVWADTTSPTPFASTANNQFLIRATGGVGIGTPNPQGSLHIYSDNNPTVVRIQSSGTPGFGRVEFVSNPQGDINQWRPSYIQSTDNGGFVGGLAFCVNGAGAGNKFGSNEVMRVVNGAVGIGTTAPVSALQVVGTVTATAFNPPSDRNLKENFASVSPREVLEKVVAMPISRWNFIGDAATPHVGPMAQDFHAAFRLGTDDRHIATVDADGVALAAIQGLNQKLEEQRAENAELKRSVQELKRLVETLGK